MTVGSRLPIEVLARIASEIYEDDDQDDQDATLFALCTVSRAWNQVAQPFLFRSLHFHLSKGVSSRNVLLRAVLLQEPRLGRWVQEIKIRSKGSGQYKREADHFRDIAHLVSLCPNLKKLDLTSCWELLDQDLLAIVESCKSLEELSIAICHKITNEGFGKALPLLKGLRKLSVWSVEKLNDTSLVAIAKLCPLLEGLNLRETSVTRAGVSSLMEFATKLTSVNLSQCSRIKKSEIAAIKKEKPSQLKIMAYTEAEIYGFAELMGQEVDEEVDDDESIIGCGPIARNRRARSW
ncbi:hypothetical protein DFS34DRAFT_627471 [Phlyctochytrium arcticum]|nr:hypothetical protein DFS34DRAFT_627471 [Phlyctochytrium arcticum]